MPLISDDEIINCFRRVDLRQWNIQLGYGWVVKNLDLDADNQRHLDYAKRLVHHALERQTRIEINTHKDLLRIWKDIRPVWTRRKDGTYLMTAPKMRLFRSLWEIH